MRKLMKELTIFDGRNLYVPHMLEELGFEYSGIGRDLYAKMSYHRIITAA